MLNSLKGDSNDKMLESDLFDSVFQGTETQWELRLQVVQVVQLTAPSSRGRSFRSFGRARRALHARSLDARFINHFEQKKHEKIKRVFPSAQR